MPHSSTRVAHLAQVLKPHQLEGVRWLFKAVHGGGGLLADDPGLGKTLQVISVIEALIKAGQASRVLIVMPANLLANWDAVRASVFTHALPAEPLPSHARPLRDPHLQPRLPPFAPLLPSVAERVCHSHVQRQPWARACRLLPAAACSARWDARRRRLPADPDLLLRRSRRRATAGNKPSEPPAQALRQQECDQLASRLAGTLQAS